jgi:hypothetical protein
MSSEEARHILFGEGEKRGRGAKPLLDARLQGGVKGSSRRVKPFFLFLPLSFEGGLYYKYRF